MSRTASEPLAPPAPAAPGEQRAPGLRARLQSREGALRLAGLAVVIAASAVLNIVRLSQNGYGNIFYSAGVRSMLRSWHNFFFVASDPGGLVSVDKPPLGLWLQAASAKVFGFHPLSLLLPEALLGVAVAAVLYVTVTRRFSVLAGVTAGLVCAVFPSFVAVSRTNNVDAPLILLMLLACAAAIRACESGRWRTLLLCRGAGRAGVQHQDARRLPRRAGDRARLSGVRAGPGPPAHRAAARRGRRDRRGVVRLDRRRRSDAGLAASLRRQLDRQHRGRSDVQLQRLRARRRSGRRPGDHARGARRARAVRNRSPRRPAARARTPEPSAAATRSLRPNSPNVGRYPKPIAFGGSPSPLRLFGVGLGDQAGWLLPFAFFGLIAALALLWLERREPAPGRRERRDARRGRPELAAGPAPGRGDRARRLVRSRGVSCSASPRGSCTPTTSRRSRPVRARWRASASTR